MKYIGNYKEWVQRDWVEKIISSVGQARPRDWSPINKIESSEYSRYQEAGYDLDAVNWYVFEKKDVDFDINPPWVKHDFHWWITKLYPGQYMPMHTDPHTHDKECKRYWVPLQDYHPGHIFVYKDTMVTNYKAGDVFTYYSSTDPHGAANIGHIPRVVLQVTEYQ